MELRGSNKGLARKMDPNDLFDDEVTLDWSLKYVVICLLLTLGEEMAPSSSSWDLVLWGV